MILISVYISMIVFLLILGVGYHSKPQTQKRKKANVIVSCFVMFLIMAMRSPSVGTDAQTVVRMFMANRPILASGLNSLFYNFISKIGYMIWPNGQMILIINAAIICVLVGALVYNNSDDVFLSLYLYITLYFYFSSFNTMRQYDAMAMCMMCYMSYKNDKRALSLVFSILALLTHSTSMVFIVVVIAYKCFAWLRNLNVQLVFGTILTFVLGYLFEPLLLLFAKIFPHYEMYIGDTGITLNGYQSDGKKILITLMLAGILLFSYITILKTKKMHPSFDVSEDFRMQFFFMIIAISLGIAGTKLQLIARMESYFSIYAILFIPKAVKMIQLRYRNIIYVGFVLLMIVPMFVQLSGNNSGVLPYRTFF